MPLTWEISCGRTEEQLKRHTSLSDSVKALVGDEQTQEGLHLGKYLLFVFKIERSIEGAHLPSNIAHACTIHQTQNGATRLSEQDKRYDEVATTPKRRLSASLFAFKLEWSL